MKYKVKLTHKNANTKKEMANSNRNVFDWIELPFEKIPDNHNAGFIHTGEYEDQNFTLIIADFDLVPELKGRPYIYESVEWRKRINRIGVNWQVWSPSGGLHLYFLIKGIHNIPNSTKWKTFDKNVVMDIRGHNGIIFSPWTNFPKEDWKESYIPLSWDTNYIYNVEDIEDDLSVVFGVEFTKKEPPKPREIEMATWDWSPKIDPRDIETNAGQFIVRDLNAQQIYQRILDGLYIIPHGDVGNVKEFRIWKNLWLWAYWQGIRFEFVFERLRLNQPNFQEDTTIQQLKFVDFAYRPSPDETRIIWEDYRRNLDLPDWGN